MIVTPDTTTLIIKDRGFVKVQNVEIQHVSGMYDLEDTQARVFSVRGAPDSHAATFVVEHPKIAEWLTDFLMEGELLPVQFPLLGDGFRMAVRSASPEISDFYGYIHRFDVKLYPSRP